MFLADVCVHFTGKKSYHASTMSFWCHHVDLHFALFLKPIHTEELHHCKLF